MAVISASKISKGTFLMFKGVPQQVVGTEFMNPGKGSAVMRVKFRNVQTGTAAEFTYKTSEMVEVAEVDKKEMQYLYHDGENVMFMDPRTYDQAMVPVALMEDQLGYLTADMLCWVLWYGEKAIGVILPPNVNLKVVEAPQAVAGNTVNAPKKLVVLETGLKVLAPLFVKEGDILIIKTSTGEYVSRA